ncbi:secretion system protein [archaeon SCG-AAA382B04]|nr:secretion system protein [archaeon SCG-AAA382B04]
MKISFYQKIGHKVFGNYFNKNRDNYHHIKKNIDKARMSIPIDYWMSSAALSGLLTTITMLTVSIILMILMGNLNIVSYPSLSLTELFNNTNQFINEIIVNLKGFILILVGIGGPIILGFIIYFLFQLIPRIKASGRAREIDALLPYAINYISAMAGAGVTPVETFKLLASSKDIYGEVSVEAKYLIRDTEMFGKDIISSMRSISKTTPSGNFQDFLQGTITTITSGGNLETYFKSKADQFMRENRRTQKEFLETLGLIGESYVTAFVAGPLFIIVMVVVMSMMGGASLIILYLIIYGGIPFGSVIFVLLVDIISPEV